MNREIFIQKGYLRKEMKDESEQTMPISGRKCPERENIWGKGPEAVTPESEESSVIEAQ